LAPKLQKGNVLILDNVSAHEPNELREILTPKGVKVIFLPQDEPELNPIELIWSQMKCFLKKHTATLIESLYQTISQALLSITQKNASHCFQHCFKKTVRKIGVHPSG
jgi:transposase